MSPVSAGASPANALGKAAEGGASTWGSTAYVEDLHGVLAHGVCLTQSQLSWPFGE